MIGRCIFGLGGENLNISQFNAILSWFSHTELSMTLSIIATINRLSTTLNDSLSPVIVSHTSFGFTLLVGTLFCRYSLICSLILKKIEKTKENSSNSSSNKPENFKIQDFTSFNSSLWLLSLNCTFVYDAVYCFNNIASNYFQRRFNYWIWPYNQHNFYNMWAVLSYNRSFARRIRLKNLFYYCFCV